MRSLVAIIAYRITIIRIERRLDEMMLVALSRG